MAQALAESEAARLHLASLDDEALPAVREAADLERTAYRSGRSDVFRLLDAERTLSEIERDRWDAWLARGLAIAEILWLAGEETP